MTIEDHVLAARLARPYYARPLAALTPVARPGLGTVAVDRHWRLYYDSDWLDSLLPDHAATLIGAHEVEHLLRDHAGRCEACGADPHTYNVAGDAAINDDIPEPELPPGHVRPASLGAPDGLIEEEYLDFLRGGQHQTCGGGSGAGRTIDDELPAPDDCDTPGIMPAEAERIRDRTAADVREHMAAHGRGSVPAGLAMWADARAVPVRRDWRAMLSATLRGIMARGAQDYTYARPSRRSAPGIILPGSCQRRPRVAVLVDTSGSMADDGPGVLGEVRRLIDDIDAHIYEADAGPARRVRSVEFRGGGGTDLRPGMAQLAARYDHVVVVTDGDTPWPDSRQSATIVLVGAAAECAPPTWARVVRAAP